MKLSHRLETIASFVHRGSKIADIGTDHGYIPIYLIEKGQVASALAMDIGKGPLERAKAHIKEHGLEQRIETRLSDGLQMLLPGEVETVIIAGMGGELLIHIMEQGTHMWDSVRQWILSPQSDIGRVRHFLADRGFSIHRETMVKDEGKYYTVMEAVWNGKSPDWKNEERYLQYGKYLIQEGHPVLAEYLKKEKKKTVSIIAFLEQQETKIAKRRVLELKKELALIEEAQDELQGNHRNFE